MINAVIRILVALFACMNVALAQEAAWKPTQAVELVVPAGPGGANDVAARTIQKILQDKRIVDAPINVVNKPGGAHSVGLAYLNQRAASGHVLMIEAVDILTNQLTAKSKAAYTDVTQVAQLYSDYIAFSVKSDSPIDSAKALASAFKKDAAALSFAISSSIGNPNHVAIAMVGKAVGADVKKAKIVVFTSAAETQTALMGGHVSVVAGPASIAAQQLASGQIRVVAVAAPQRLAGALANVPTWKELGIDAVAANWRSVVGPKSMTHAQLAYWEQVFAKLTQTPEWRKDLELHQVVGNYLDSADTRRYWDAQFNDMKAVLSELGLIK